MGASVGSVKRTVSIEIGDNPTFGELYSIPIADWMSMPTLCQGHSEDLKYDGDRYRVWVGRTSIYDWNGDSQGYTDSQLSFEELINGRWIALDRYGKRRDR